ncbi:hypothetical protein KAR91_08320 [Candidatus Pacearchaeota archaeon]|nr:hypothetical protein [Candidatus Pacearchaeota archaeon]
MTVIGGSIESISLSGRNFSVAADAEGQRKLGGTINEVQSNGDGTARIIKTREPWSLDGLTVAVDDARADQEFLQNLADANDFFAIAVTLASGVVYQGSGQITGDLQFSTQNAMATVSLMGQEKLTKQ